jgi:hypothetical protein
MKRTKAAQTIEDRERERVTWLLDLLHIDLAALRPGELLDWRNEVFPKLHGVNLSTVTVFDPAELRALGRVADGDPNGVIAAARELMSNIQGQLRAGVDELHRTGKWQPFTAARPAPGWSLERQEDGAIRRVYTGTWSTVTLASAVDLLVAWWPQLRRCEYKPCSALFLPKEGRQRFHDPKCSGLARWHRLPKPKRDYTKDEQRRAQREYDKKHRRLGKGKK